MKQKNGSCDCPVMVERSILTLTCLCCCCVLEQDTIDVGVKWIGHISNGSMCSKVKLSAWACSERGCCGGEPCTDCLQWKWHALFVSNRFPLKKKQKKKHSLFSLGPSRCLCMFSLSPHCSESTSVHSDALPLGPAQHQWTQRGVCLAELAVCLHLIHHRAKYLYERHWTERLKGFPRNLL